MARQRRVLLEEVASARSGRVLGVVRGLVFVELASVDDLSAA
jgi:hypothetical protein